MAYKVIRDRIVGAQHEYVIICDATADVTTATTDLGQTNIAPRLRSVYSRR